MLEIRRYTPVQKQAWNDFVSCSKNGTFLLDRDYMDYHADRFTDHSLMVYRRNKLYALLPGNRTGDTFYSHQGLTYGGLIMSDKTVAADVVQIFRLLNDLLRQEGIRKVIYKAIPWIYHRQPSDEDLYAVVEVCGATVSRGLSSAVSRDHLNKWYRIRESGAKYARKMGLTIQETDDYKPFWQVLSNNLRERYGLLPVHTVEEIELLHRCMPDHIRLIVVKEGSETVGGTVLYVSDRVVHSQYIAASPRGKQIHALDLLFDVVIRQALASHAYFDFGISTERHGTYLNEQLIYQKEGFGGRGVCYDWYEWKL
ncbi:MAG: GNAT family N-acetyltransferase [Prevotella sp.]|nr:GNAT family N-acetyltransferase [Prevotella sp.]